MVVAWDHGWVCTGFLKRAGVAPKRKDEAEWCALAVGAEFKEESRVLVEVFGRRWLYYDWKGLAPRGEAPLPERFPEQLAQFQEQAGSSTPPGRR